MRAKGSELRERYSAQRAWGSIFLFGVVSKGWKRRVMASLEIGNIKVVFELPIIQMHLGCATFI